ncbi:MAG: DUF4221 family protein [Cytophagia bacterium]|nr:DUF4221 family protein [Cytophagia bacterium]
MKFSFKHILLICLSGAISYSCNSSKEKSEASQQGASPLEIVDLGTKSFPLDAETAVDFNSRFKVNVFDGKEYLSFANRPLSRIYEFDYESGEPSRTIKLEKDGPNAVNLWWNIGMFFHSKDSIFLDSGGFGYYLVNGKGEVLQKFGMPNKENTLEPECCPIVFTNATFFENGVIYGEQNPNPSDNEQDLDYAFGSYNLKSDEKNRSILEKSAFIPDHQKIKEMVKAKDPWVRDFTASFYASNDLLFTSSPISDSVHIFEDFNLLEKLYISYPETELADYRSFLLINQLQEVSNGIQNLTEVNQPPHYSGLLVSANGNLIYRILIEETRGKMFENTNEEYPEITKASLIVFNRTTNSIGRYELPVEDIEIPFSTVSRSVFVNKSGIHFQTKEQASEDRLDFRVFGVKEE